MAIVRVALPLPLPQVFDYTAEDAGVEDVGRCVKVPFGRGERTGLIVGLGEQAGVETARLKTVLHIQRGVPPLPSISLKMFPMHRHVASQYADTACNRARKTCCRSCACLKTGRLPAAWAAELRVPCEGP